MMEQLEEVSDYLIKIISAFKAAKSLQQKNSKLSMIIEQAKKKALEMEKIELPDEPLLKELKLTAAMVQESGVQLEHYLLIFGNRTDLLEIKLKEMNLGQSQTVESIHDICKIIIQLDEMSPEYLSAVKNLSTHVKKAQSLVEHLVAQHLEGRKHEKEMQALRKRKASEVSFEAGAIGLAQAALNGGSIFSFALVAGAVRLYFSKGAVDLRKEAESIKKEFDKLNVIAKELKSIGEDLKVVKLSEQDFQAIRAALEFYSEEMKKARGMEDDKAKIREQNATITEKDNTIAEKDSTIAEKDNTIAEQNRKIAELEKQIAASKAS